MSSLIDLQLHTHTHTRTNVSTGAIYYKFSFKRVHFHVFRQHSRELYYSVATSNTTDGRLGGGNCGNVLAEPCTKCSRELFLPVYKLPREDPRTQPPQHRRAGMVTMYTPNKYLGKSFAPPAVDNIKHGIYSSIELIMDSLCKQVFRNKLASSSKQFPISWKIDAQTQRLRVKFSGNNYDRLILKAQSAVLQNILGMTTLVDCSSSPSNAKDRSENGNGGGGHDAFQTKIAAQYPTDLNAGCHTILIYCDIVQNEILGDCQTALLRAIPLPTFHHQNQPYDSKSSSTRVSVIHQPAAFTSLQYQRLPIYSGKASSRLRYSQFQSRYETKLAN